MARTGKTRWVRNATSAGPHGNCIGSTKGHEEPRRTATAFTAKTPKRQTDFGVLAVMRWQLSFFGSSRLLRAFALAVCSTGGFDTAARRREGAKNSNYLSGKRQMRFPTKWHEGSRRTAAAFTAKAPKHQTDFGVLAVMRWQLSFFGSSRLLRAFALAVCSAAAFETATRRREGSEGAKNSNYLSGKRQMRFPTKWHEGSRRTATAFTAKAPNRLWRLGALAVSSSCLPFFAFLRELRVRCLH